MANLLTNEAKKKLVRERKIRELVLSLGLLAVLLLIAVVLNVSLWLSFRIQKDIPIAKGLATSSPSSAPVNSIKETVQIKEKLSLLSKWWPNNTWSSVVAKVEKIRPATVKISQITGLLSEKDNTISLAISGQALGRQELVKFVDDLKKEKAFSKVDLPIDYLLSTAKGQFTINLEIKNND